MESKKHVTEKRNDILSASEIGQYTYCSISWYLQRCGYEPDSPHLEQGKTLHKNLGVTLDKVHSESMKIRRYALLGLLLMVITGIIIVFEVIL